MELDIEYLADPITVGTERKIWFQQLLDYQKLQFLKPGKYSIINKSTPFAHSYCPYFASFLHKSQQWLFLKKTNKIVVKTRKKHIPDYSWSVFAPITLSWLWNCRTISKEIGISISGCILYSCILAVSSLVWTHQHV